MQNYNKLTKQQLKFQKNNNATTIFVNISMLKRMNPANTGIPDRIFEGPPRMNMQKQE